MVVGAGPLGRAVEVVENSAAALSEGIELDAARQGIANPEPFHARLEELLDVDGLIKIVADDSVAADFVFLSADHVVSPFDGGAGPLGRRLLFNDVKDGVDAGL